MSSAIDSIAIIGSSFRLAGGIDNPDELWKTLLEGDWSRCSTSAPPSRHVPGTASRDDTPGFCGGWLGTAGVEEFDPLFFDVTQGEADALRPNARLALELTWEALENAGIAPSSLRGKNVAVSLAMGSDDGWEMRRFAEGGEAAFDHLWGLNSEPSAVAGRVAQFLDFQGATAVVSGACASGALALDYATHALVSQGADIAIVGAISTYFTSAAFLSASKSGMLSRSGRCKSFSDDADGYHISEAAVFFIVKKSSLALSDGDVIDGLLRAVSISHNGSTGPLTHLNVAGQRSTQLRALQHAGVEPGDITYLEAQASGTLLGDQMELEAIKGVYNESTRRSPLLMSSYHTVLGHCHSASVFVAILKVIMCFRHRCIPPHHVSSYANDPQSGIIVPADVVHLDTHRSVLTALNSFSATGILASIVMQEPPPRELVYLEPYPLHILPFSAKTSASLQQAMVATYSWACDVGCSLQDLALLLSSTRDYHKIRKAFVVGDLADLGAAINAMPTEIIPNLPEDTSSTYEDLQEIKRVYESGGELLSARVHSRHSIHPTLLRGFPTYPFERRVCWNTSTRNTALAASQLKPTIAAMPRVHGVQSAVCSILRLEESEVHPKSNIFDLGINSFNAMELVDLLSTTYARKIGPVELYQLLTVEAIENHLSGSSDAPSPTVQEEIEHLAEEFGAPLECRAHPKTTRETSSMVTILLTGATGFVGSNVLVYLLELPSVQVVCLIRGNPLTRLRGTFKQFELDETVLDRRLHDHTLRLVAISDLSRDSLGCSAEDYCSLLKSVDYVIHCAWKVDFNFSVGGFRSDLIATRQLAQLCALCDKPAVLFFMSSFSATVGYGKAVPGEPVALDTRYSLNQGYALSKLVAEHVLYRLQGTAIPTFRVCILRIGQVCGHSKTGVWVENEMIPMLISVLPCLRATLLEMPGVSWLPSDVCAGTIRDILIHEMSDVGDAHAPVSVHNLANPAIRSWKDVLLEIADVVGCAAPHFLPLPEFVTLLQRAKDASNIPKAVSESINRLLPYFHYTLATGGLPQHWASLDVSHTANISDTLLTCPPIQHQLIHVLVTRLFADNLVPDSPLHKSILSKRPVFIFGPWSSARPNKVTDAAIVTLTNEMRDLASAVLRTRIPRMDHSGLLSQSAPLHSQLFTLASHIDALRRLRNRDVKPVAAAGYCYGEFAAAICCGLLSEHDAVELITLRAYAVDHIQRCHWERDDKHCRGIDCQAESSAGLDATEPTMLNVFASAGTVKRHLILIPSPAPELAIIAGPTHVILSGSALAVKQATIYFEEQKVKSRVVETTVPFHSVEIEPAVHLLTKLLSDSTPSASRKATSKRQEPVCAYVSGLTGRVLRGTSLGRNYWLRHMRQTFLFRNVVETIYKSFHSTEDGVVVVDLGPGSIVCNMVKRNDCSGMPVDSLDQFLSTGDVDVLRQLPARAVDIPKPVEHAESVHPAQMSSSS